MLLATWKERQRQLVCQPVMLLPLGSLVPMPAQQELQELLVPRVGSRQDECGWLALLLRAILAALLRWGCRWLA